MAKLIASMNMTVDGFCDHTYGVPDEEMHQHYNDLLKASGTMLWGRTTYQLMEDYWPAVAKKPTGNRAVDEFGVLIDAMPKIVFSRTLKDVAWKNTTLKKELSHKELVAQAKQADKDFLLGSPSLIAQMTRLGCIDEFQLCMHPVIAGKGLVLFKDLREKVRLKLLKTKTFGSGAVVLYYQPT